MADYSNRHKRQTPIPPAPKNGKLVWTFDEIAWPVELRQAGRDDFTVIYGKQINKGLTYAEACKLLGGALLHGFACDGKIDNREAGER